MKSNPGSELPVLVSYFPDFALFLPEAET